MLASLARRHVGSSSCVLAAGPGRRTRVAAVSCRTAAATTRPAAAAVAAAPSRSSSRHQCRRAPLAPCRAEPQDGTSSSSSSPARPVQEFGYSRKDVLIIIVGLIGLGVVMYEGLQAAGMDAGLAGNWVQATIFLGICVGWVSTYLWRVANKKMTYAQQLEMYEAAVMQKRLEEMTEAELQQLLSEVEADKARMTAAKAALQQKKQQQQNAGQ